MSVIDPNMLSSNTTPAATIRRTPVWLAAAMAAAAISVLVATPAKANPVIQVGRDWGLVQKNGYYVHLQLSQTGSALSGDAQAAHGQYGDTVLSSGGVTGTVTDQHIHLEIPWSASSVGEYDGNATPTIDGDGRIYFVGQTCDQKNSAVCAGWYADTSFARP